VGKFNSLKENPRRDVIESIDYISCAMLRVEYIEVTFAQYVNILYSQGGEGRMISRGSAGTSLKSSGS